MFTNLNITRLSIFCICCIHIIGGNLYGEQSAEHTVVEGVVEVDGEPAADVYVRALKLVSVGNSTILRKEKSLISDEDGNITFTAKINEKLYFVAGNHGFPKQDIKRFLIGGAVWRGEKNLTVSFTSVPVKKVDIHLQVPEGYIVSQQQWKEASEKKNANSRISAQVEDPNSDVSWYHGTYLRPNKNGNLVMYIPASDGKYEIDATIHLRDGIVFEVNDVALDAETLLNERELSIPLKEKVPTLKITAISQENGQSVQMPRNQKFRDGHYIVMLVNVAPGIPRKGSGFDENGIAYFYDLPSGNYKVQLMPKLQAKWTIVPQSKEVVIEDGHSGTHVHKLVLTKTEIVSIRGRVVNSVTSAPVEGAHITYGTKSEKSDKRGMFEIKTSDEDASLHVKHRDFYKIEEIKKSEGEMVVRLIPKPLFEGKITNLPDNLMHGRVRIWGAEDPFTTELKDDGTWAAALRPGKYHVTVYGEGDVQQAGSDLYAHKAKIRTPLVLHHDVVQHAKNKKRMFVRSPHLFSINVEIDENNRFTRMPDGVILTNKEGFILSSIPWNTQGVEFKVPKGKYGVICAMEERRGEVKHITVNAEKSSVLFEGASVRSFKIIDGGEIVMGQPKGDQHKGHHH